MKSRSASKAPLTPSPVQSVQTQAADMGNAAAQEGLDAVGLSETPMLDQLGLPDLPDDPASAVADRLGLGDLQVDEDSVSLRSSAAIDESIDLTLGCLGPLTVGLHGGFSAALDYGFEGDIVGGWFGGRYATVQGDASMDLDTCVQAKVALDLLVAEGGLRGGLTLKGGLRGTTEGTLSFDEDGVHLDSLTLHVEGEAALGAAAELYVDTALTDEQTWDLGALPLGVAGGFMLDLTWGDGGLTDMSGSLGSGFVMSPELEGVIERVKGAVGM